MEIQLRSIILLLQGVITCEYRGDDGMEYTDNGDETYTDEIGIRIQL